MRVRANPRVKDHHLDRHASKRTSRTVRASRDGLPRNAGMTLVEILVAIALFGLLSAALVTALQVGAGAWQRTRSRLTLDRRIATANSILHAEFAGIAPILAQIPPERRVGIPNLVFFQGEPDAMRFVTSYSVTEGRRGGLRITELRIVDSSQGRRVLLNQMPYRGPLSAGSLVEGYLRNSSFPRGRVIFQPIQTRPDSLVIMDELEECSFSYLKEPPMFNASSEWAPLWDDLFSLPAAVAVRLTARGEEARLLPVSIVAAIPAKGPSQ